jgi:hypothetical protein
VVKQYCYLSFLGRNITELWSIILGLIFDLTRDSNAFNLGIYSYDDLSILLFLDGSFT